MHRITFAKVAARKWAKRLQAKRPTLARKMSESGIALAHKALEIGSPEIKKKKKKKKKKKNRCAHEGCKKKLTLVEKSVGKCRCGLIFCSQHRYASAHNCTFDYVSDASKLSQGLGGGKADKILRI
eukprot:g5203.t1